MRHGLERVPEKDQEIYFSFGDPRSDLQISAQRATLEPFDLKGELFSYVITVCDAKGGLTVRSR